MDRIGSKHPVRLYIREWMLSETPTLTQKRLAERMDTEPGTVSKLLNGHMEMTTNWLAHFADALDLSVPDLFRDPKAPTRDELLRGYSNEELTSALQLIETTRRAISPQRADMLDTAEDATARRTGEPKRVGGRK